MRQIDVAAKRLRSRTQMFMQPVHSWRRQSVSSHSSVKITLTDSIFVNPGVNSVKD